MDTAMALARAGVRKEVSACTKCELHKVGHGPVPFSGPTPARIAVCGEAPGRTEDEQGKPFIGRSGQLLREMLDEVGIPVETQCCFINTVSCYPDRTPQPPEIDACDGNFQAQMMLANPRYVLILGAVALTKFRSDVKISQVRGRIMLRGDRVLYPTFHPAAALRDGRKKAVLKQDLSHFAESVLMGYIYTGGCVTCSKEPTTFDADHLPWCDDHGERAAIRWEGRSEAEAKAGVQMALLDGRVD